MDWWRELLETDNSKTKICFERFSNKEDFYGIIRIVSKIQLCSHNIFNAGLFTTAKIGSNLKVWQQGDQ